MSIIGSKTAVSMLSRGPRPMVMRQPSATTSPASADAAARQARDHAHPPAFIAAAPSLSLAGSWHDLVKNLTLTPNPPRFGAEATVRFELTQRAVSVQLGEVHFLVALSGSARATVNLTVPPLPELHTWRCNKCPQTFTLNPTEQACKRGAPPVLHDFACANRVRG